MSQPLALCTGQALCTSQCRQPVFFTLSCEEPSYLDRNTEIVHSSTWESGQRASLLHSFKGDVPWSLDSCPFEGNQPALERRKRVMTITDCKVSYCSHESQNPSKFIGDISCCGKCFGFFLNLTPNVVWIRIISPRVRKSVRTFLLFALSRSEAATAKHRRAPWKG